MEGPHRSFSDPGSCDRRPEKVRRTDRPGVQTASESPIRKSGAPARGSTRCCSAWNNGSGANLVQACFKRPISAAAVQVDLLALRDPPDLIADRSLAVRNRSNEHGSACASEVGVLDLHQVCARAPFGSRSGVPILCRLTGRLQARSPWIARAARRLKGVRAIGNARRSPSERARGLLGQASGDGRRRGVDRRGARADEPHFRSAVAEGPNPSRIVGPGLEDRRESARSRAS